MTEVYDSIVGAGVALVDCLADVDAKLNATIGAGRAKGLSGRDLADHVHDVLGQPVPPALHLAPIEAWLEAMPLATPKKPGKRYRHRLADTKYAGIEKDSLIWKHGGDTMLASVIRCGGINMGTDKLGHFFQLGYSLRDDLRGLKGAAARTRARTWNRASEMGTFGLDITQVFSWADIAANMAGARFYRDLEAGMTGKVSLASRITRDWNEESRNSDYSRTLGSVVWNNVVPGAWDSRFTVFPNAATVPCTVSITRLMKDVFVGTYEYISAGKSVGGDLTLALTLRTHGRVVKGADLKGSWSSGSARGGVLLKSDSESSFTGTWGHGSHTTGGGDWSFIR